MTASLADMHIVCSQIKGLALILDQLLVKQEVNTPSCVSLSLKWKDVKTGIVETGCLSRFMLDKGFPILLRSFPISSSPPYTFGFFLHPQPFLSPDSPHLPLHLASIVQPVFPVLAAPCTSLRRGFPPV